MSPHRGFIGTSIKRRDDYAIFRALRDYLGAETFKGIIPKVELIIRERDRLIQERDKYRERFEAISSEFGRKKIGVYMKIRRVGKHQRTKKKGVLYFRKEHIGKHVIVWEKK